MTKQEFDTLAERIVKTNDFNYAGFLTQFTALLKVFDKARLPVADAAFFLFSCQPALQNWLIVSHPEKIKLSAKVNGEAAFKQGLPVSLARRAFAHIDLGDGFVPMYILRADQFALVDSRDNLYPDRQATADAAEFLATQMGVGSTYLEGITPGLIREDAKDWKAVIESRQVEVSITVSRLFEGASGGYIDLKFYKGDVKVGEVTILGKTTAPYTRRITLSGPYDMVRAESTPSAIYSIERVKK